LGCGAQGRLSSPGDRRPGGVELANGPSRSGFSSGLTAEVAGDAAGETARDGTKRGPDPAADGAELHPGPGPAPAAHHPSGVLRVGGLTGFLAKRYPSIED